MAVLFCALACVSDASAQSERLPDQVVLALDAKIPGWRLPSLVEIAEEKSYNCGPPFVWAEANFDGDQRKDYAVRAIWPDSAAIRGVQEGIIVLLDREEGFKYHSFFFGGVEHTFRLVHAGEAVRLPMAFNPLGQETEIVLQADAVELGYCEKASSIYFYYGGAFVSAVTGD